MTHVQVTVTTNSEDAALRLAHSVVQARLAACAQVAGPIRSTFRWQGAVRDATEWHCYLKTLSSCLEPLERHVAEVYPADTPEIIAVPIVGGSAAYLDWIAQESGSGPHESPRHGDSQS